MTPATEYRYSTRALRADYLRAGAGIVLTAGPLAVADTGTAGAVVLGAMAALFAAYGVRTALRQVSPVAIGDLGVERGGPIRRRVPWDDLASVELSYYTTKKDRSGGWMQLKIRGRDDTVTIESSIDGFPALVAESLRRARSKGLELPPATLNNARALGVTVRPAEPETGRNGRSTIGS